MAADDLLFGSISGGEEEAASERISARSDELFREFVSHLEDARFEDPKVNERDVFEAWVIQKLAGIQVLQEDFNARVNLIAAHTRKR